MSSLAQSCSFHCIFHQWIRLQWSGILTDWSNHAPFVIGLKRVLACAQAPNRSVPRLSRESPSYHWHR